MNQSFLFERQINTCSAPYQFYQCSAGGGFSGCCSIDPCNDGNCPAENQPGGSSSQTTASKTSSISQQQTATMISSHTTATSATSTSSSSLGQTTVPSSLSTASLSTSVGNTNVVTTVTTATTILSTNTAASETATPSSNKGVLIGSCIGGVVGIILLFLLLFLWCRRRKASKTPNSNNNNNNEKRRRTLFGFHGDSDYNTSNSWGQYSENYYRKGQQHQTSPDGQVDSTKSPALTELDASPRGSPLRAYPGTVYELDSTINEGSTATDASPRAPSSDPSSPNFRSPSTMSPASQHTQTRLGDHLWQSPESDTMSNGSSPMGGGIRLAS